MSYNGPWLMEILTNDGDIYSDGISLGFGMYQPFTKTYHESDKRLLISIMNKMGFSNENDYMNVYPGKCTSYSKIFIKLHGKYDINSKYFYRNIWKFFKYDNVVDIDSGFRLFLDKLKDRCDRSQMMWLVQPTMKEVMDSENFQGVEHKDLWFCKDWGDG